MEVVVVIVLVIVVVVVVVVVVAYLDIAGSYRDCQRKSNDL